MSIQRTLISCFVKSPSVCFCAGLARAAVVSSVLAASILSAKADPLFPRFGPFFAHGNIVITESVYAGNASLITPGVTVLPNGALATADGSYPTVFNNESADPSFGITAPIDLLQLTRDGEPVDRLAVPTHLLTTSFSSKSELAIHLSTEGTALTFMGYVAPVNTLDVSNSNTPGHFDPSNPVTTTYQRCIGLVDVFGRIWAKPVNAYSGNNGRAVILSDWLYYMVGNAGNGTVKGAENIVDNTGVQIINPFGGSDSTVVGQQQGTIGAAKGYQYGYSVTQNGYAPDNSGKDDNFRGETIFNKTLYVSKGTGSNGVNTVYQVGTAGVLPRFATAATTQITIVPGFSTTLAKSTTGTVYYPFGLWFANATTLYVADEGDGVLADAATGSGGLQKWILAGSAWQLAYTLKAGLNLGKPYTVQGYPTGINPATGLAWAPAADGLRNIAGKVNRDGTVTIYGITSTVSGATDQGADPNQLVVITDKLSFTSESEAAGETFKTLRTGESGVVLRGVSFVPSEIPGDPEPKKIQR
jgi:hypothetical protein